MSSTNASPARSIDNNLAVWVPRAAATGCMGLAYWLASQNDQEIKGVYALVFPYFGSDRASRLRASYLASNLISPILIWTIEGNRAGNARNLLAVPSLVGAAMQISGIEKIAPIYYLLAIAAGDASTAGRRVTPETAVVVLPATLLAYVLPGVLMAVLPLTATEVSRSIFTPQSLVSYAFFLAPITVPILTTAISEAVRWFSRRRCRHGSRTEAADIKTEVFVGKSCDGEGRQYFPELPRLRTAYAIAFAIQAAQHIYTVTRTYLPPYTGQLSLVGVLRNLLTKPTVPGQGCSSIALYAGATLGFGLYTVWDTRRRGYTTDREASEAALGVVAGQVLVGPGATYAGLWWWREGVLARCV